MHESLHTMIAKIYEIGMVYVIPYAFNLITGYLLASFAAKFSDTRWKFMGVKLLAALFWLLQNEIVAHTGIARPLNLFLQALFYYFRILIYIKIFFVINWDKLLFVTVMYPFLNNVISLVMGMAGDFHAESVSLYIADFFSSSFEARHITTMIVSFFWLILKKIIDTIILIFGMRLISNGIPYKREPIRIGELCFLLVPAIATNIAKITFTYIGHRTLDADGMLSVYDRFPEVRPLIMSLGVMLAVVTIAGVYAFRNIVQSSKEMTDHVILQHQTEEMKQSLMEISENNERIRSIRHDMKNHVAVLLELLENVEDREELKQYVQKLNKEVHAAESDFSTGNVVIDALLTVKYRRISERLKGCRFDTDELLFPKDINISDYDLAVLLGNALDNAIEACEKRLSKSPTGDIFISLLSRIKGSILFLEVKNSCIDPLDACGDPEFPATDKDDQKEHGIGYRNMSAVAEKYLGAIEWQAENGVFTLSVMLQNISHP